MKCLLTCGWLTSLLLMLSCYNGVQAQDADIFQTYATLNYNGSLVYFEGGASSIDPRGAEAFDGQYLGTFHPDDNLAIAGAEIHTYENGGASVSGAELNYSIYKSGSSGTFSQVALSLCCISGGTDCEGGTCATGPNTDDKKWNEDGQTINVLSGLDPGEYTIQVFFKAYTSEGDKFDRDLVNGDYQATFTVGTEGFMDGDLTSNVVWSGDVADYTILDPTSLSGSGSNSYLNGVGIENNEVLVSNENTGDAVITTPSNMAYGTWQFSLATADGFTPSSSNSLKVILMSDENDVTKLKDGAYDFNGYMLEAGQNGSTDYFELIRVNGSTQTSVITTTYPGTASFELGYRIRITRAQNGDWEVFADEGFSGSAATTSRGTANDNDITTSSYFALTTEISSIGTLRRAYYDNISLNPSTELSFDITSSDNDETDGSVTVNVDIVHPSLADATTADIVLVKGDASRVENYTTQSITFPAGSAASIPITLDITDNDDCDYNTIISLEIQNVAGGIAADAGGDKVFTMNLTDDNTTSEDNVDDDFEDGDLVGWTGETSAFSNEMTTELSGSYALYTGSIEGDGNAYLVLPNTIKDLSGTSTTWRFSAATGQRDPNDLNRFSVFLTSNGDDPTATDIQGYAIAVNEGGNTDDRLRLYRIDSNSSATALISYEVPGGWGSFDNYAVQVTRNETGDWELFVNENAVFSDLTSAGTANDNTYDFMGSMAVVSYKSLADWEVWFDDVSVTQEFCSGAYETTGTGNSSGNIWQLVGTSIPATPPFNKYTEIIVKSGDVLTVDSDLRAGAVTIESGGELDLGVGNQDLEVFGDLAVNGVLTAQKGSITMGGNTGVQQIMGAATPVFYELNVENADGVNMNVDADFYGPIHANSGTLNFGTQQITLASDDINGEILTGSIGEILMGADVVGQITMERYVESFEDGYRLIGMPIYGQTVSSAFSGDFDLTGFPGSDWPDHYFTNLKYYNEPQHVANDYNIGFVDVLNVTETVDPHKGYWAYFPPGTSNYTLDATGDFNKGDVTINLDYTSLGDDQYDGWNCIVNPYPSAIDIMSPEIELVNCERAAYILDHTLGSTWKGEYVSYHNGVSNNGGSNIVSSYQAFFIKATGPGASITFKEGAKVDNQADFLRFDDVSRSLIKFAVSSENHQYETVVSFHEEASNGYDSAYDGYFLPSNSVDEEAGLTICTRMEESTLSINTLSSITEPMTIPFVITVPEDGSYVLRVGEMQNMANSSCMLIENTSSGEFTEVSESAEISLDVTDGTQVIENYVLHLYPAAEVEAEMVSCYGSEDGQLIVDAPSYSEWQFEWTDENGTVLDAQTSGLTSTLDDIGPGNYIVIMTSNTDYCSVLTEEVTITEPLEEIIDLEYGVSTCSDETGQIGVSVWNTNSWTIALMNDEGLVLEQENEGEFLMNDLAGDEYTVLISSQCLTNEFVINLEDENAVDASFEAPEEVFLEAEVVAFNALNTGNGLYNSWLINEELVAQSEDLYFEFNTPGTYDVLLISSNDYCQDEFHTSVTVSMADEITELADGITILNLNDQIQISLLDVVDKGVIELVDMAGRTIKAEVVNGTQHMISKTGLASGVYALIIKDQNGVILAEKIWR